MPLAEPDHIKRPGVILMVSLKPTTAILPDRTRCAFKETVLKRVHDLCARLLLHWISGAASPLPVVLANSLEAPGA